MFPLDWILITLSFLLYHIRKSTMSIPSRRLKKKWIFGFSCTISWKEFSLLTSLSLLSFSFCFSLDLLHSLLNICSSDVSQGSGVDIQICGSTSFPVWVLSFCRPSTHTHAHTHSKHTKKIWGRSEACNFKWNKSIFMTWD